MKTSKCVRLVIGALSAACLLSPLPAAAESNLLDAVKERGVIRVCELDYPPLNIKNPMTGEWTGLLVEMAEAFAASHGLKVEHVDSTWGTVIQNVNQRRCDISIGATFVTEERAKQALFTDTVTEDSQAAFVKADAPFQSYEELDKAGTDVVVVSGSLNEANAKQTFKHATIRPVITDRQQTPVLEVAAGRADAAFISIMATANFLTANKNLKVRQVDDSKLFPSPIAWIVALDEVQLQKAVNEWLAAARADGTLERLEQKWLRGKD